MPPPSAATVSPPAPAAGTAAALRERMVFLALLLSALGAWMLQHPYKGLYHDAVVYALPALARLHPSLSADVFLRYGSQDAYTLFSPLYAAVIRWLDLEPAAALLTALAQLTFYVSGWLLARRFMTAQQAWLAVGLLIALPGSYGLHGIFTYGEGFCTSRALAEGLVLGALAAAVRGRHGLCAGCLGVALALHPIMACAGVALLGCRLALELRRALVLAACAAGALLAAGMIALAPATFTRIDPTWLDLIRLHAPFLFMDDATLADASRNAFPLTVLLVGICSGSGRYLRLWCGAGIAAALLGVLISGIYADGFHWLLAVQMQAWRWLWLARVLAVLLLPAVGYGLWNRGAAGRAAVLLLATSCLLDGDSWNVAVLCTALACALAARFGVGEPLHRPVFAGALALLALMTLDDAVAKAGFVDLGARFDDTPDEIALRWLRAWSRDGVYPGALLLLGGWLTGPRRSLRAAGIAALVAAICVAALAPATWRSWTRGHFTAAYREQFAAWRTYLPAHAQVLWPDTPVGAWYVLERASYWSVYQDAGDIFSRRKALETDRRDRAIAAALRAAQPAIAFPSGAPASATASASRGPTPTMLTASGLRAACQDPELTAVVSWLRLGPAPVAAVTPLGARPGSQLHLYACGDFRG